MARRVFIEKPILLENPQLQLVTRENPVGQFQTLTFSGTHQVAELENQNGRIYPLSLFEKSMSSDAYVRRLETRSMFGQLGHPDDGVVDPGNISHVTVETKIMHSEASSQGGVPIWAKSEIVPTPEGKILQTLHEARLGIGVSSRGFGDAFESSESVVLTDDFELMGYDAVTDPSVALAIPVADWTSNFESIGSRVNERVAIFGEVSDPITRAAMWEEMNLYRRFIESLGKDSAGDDIRHVLQESIDLRPPKMHCVLDSACSTTKEQVEVEDEDEDEEDKTQKQDDQESDFIDADKAEKDESIGGSEMPDKATEEGLTTALTGLQTAVSKDLIQLRKENADLKKKYGRIRKSNRQLSEKLGAAADLVKRMTTRIEGGSRRYEAAKRLAKAAIEEFQKVRGESRLLRRRGKAAESLVQAATTRVVTESRSRMSSHVETLVARIPTAHQESSRSMLRTCRSVQEANNRYRGIQRMIGSVGSHDEDVREARRMKGAPVEESSSRRNRGKMTSEDREWSEKCSPLMAGLVEKMSPSSDDAEMN